MNQNDIIISLFYFIHKNFSEDGNVYSTSSRRMDKDERPFFRIQNAQHQTQQMGSAGFIDQHIWNIWYYGKDQNNSRYTSDLISQKLNNDRMIQGYLFNYEMPEPGLIPQSNFSYTDSDDEEQDGAINVSNLCVSVTGIVEGVSDEDGSIVYHESLPSEPKMVNMENANSLSVYFPNVPYSKTHFDYYNVYAGTEEDHLVLQNNSPIRHSVDSNGKIDRRKIKNINLAGLQTSGNNPPEKSTLSNLDVDKLLPFYQIYVQDTKVELMENDIKNDLWDTKIELTTYTRGLLFNPAVVVPINNLIVRAFSDGQLFYNDDAIYDDDGEWVRPKTYEDHGVSNPKVPI